MGKNLRTQKALIESGAYVAGDFEEAPIRGALSTPARGIGKQVTQAEYDRQLAEQKRRQEAKYRAYKAGK